MSDDDRPSDVLGGLPRSRPERRSEKRPAVPGAQGPPPEPTAGRKPTANAARAPVSPRAPATATAPAEPPPAPVERRDPLGIAVQAVGELAQIGVTVGVRALRQAWSRLPRP